MLLLLLRPSLDGLWGECECCECWICWVWMRGEVFTPIGGDAAVPPWTLTGTEMGWCCCCCCWWAAMYDACTGWCWTPFIPTPTRGTPTPTPELTGKPTPAPPTSWDKREISSREDTRAADRRSFSFVKNSTLACNCANHAFFRWRHFKAAKGDRWVSSVWWGLKITDTNLVCSVLKSSFVSPPRSLASLIS